MVDIGDVRLEGVSHEQIMRWIGEGDADSTTHAFEARMQKVVSVLNESGENTNRAVQRANAGDWQGTTAESAHQAMVTMRDYDDAMHGHSENNRYSAMGQSGESAATRNRIPLPVPMPGAGGNRPVLVDATQDPGPQESARSTNEDLARQIMGEYRDATKSRVAALPAIPPVPKVVLATGGDAPGPKNGGSAPTHRGGGQPDVPNGGGDPAVSPTGGPSGTSAPGSVPGGQHGGAPPPAVQGTDPSSVGAPPTVGPTPLSPVGSGPGGTSQGAPNGSWGGAPGAPYGTPGGSSGGYGGSGGGRGYGGGSGAPGEAGQAGGRGAGQSGARSGAGMAAAEESVLRRGGAAGAARTGGPGMGGMLGGGHGAEGDEDTEHTNKYGLSSDEHFEEDEEFLRDPRNKDFFVAPDVIGGPE